MNADAALFPVMPDPVRTARRSINTLRRAGHSRAEAAEIVCQVASVAALRCRSQYGHDPGWLWDVADAADHERGTLVTPSRTFRPTERGSTCQRASRK